MSYQLTPATPEGERFVAAAASLVATLRERAAAADAESEVNAANFADLASSGVSAAFVPQELGGLGLASVHDWLAGIATLGRGDGSTAIAINMHLGVSRGMAQGYAASGGTARGVRHSLETIAAGELLICATATEAGTDNLHPLTEAKRVDDGWRIDGHKMFVTLSPIATHLAMNLRMRDDDGDHLATVMMPIDTPGVLPQNDWHALGMRGSGSQSIKFDGARVPESAVRIIGPWGRWSTPVIINRTLGNLPLVAAFLGIAEHAYEIGIDAVKKNKRVDKPVSEHPGVQHTVGEMEITLATCRSVLQQAGHGVDRLFASLEGKVPTDEQAYGLLKDYQSAKWVVNRGAIEIVSKAMDLAGGGAFMDRHPLSRLYRDVRAGPFMQPFAPIEVRQFVGKVALGIYPRD